MKRTYIRKTVFSAMFAALVFSATWISFPTGLGGNVNLGDSLLLITAWTLGGPWSVIAGAVGPMLTDLLGGYAIYAPATLIIKALMVSAALLVAHLLRRLPTACRYPLSGLAAETVMVLGYFIYESIIFSIPTAAIAIPFNLIQGGVSILLACLIRAVLSKARLDRVIEE